MGSVLSQKQNEHERVIAYYSKSLNKAERAYCVTRRELLAIVASIKHFHHFLVGQKFLIRTDHGALRWLMNFKNPEAQVARWLELLGNYQFEIEHRPGRYHGNADGLSRRPCPENDCKQCEKMHEKSKDKVVHVPAKYSKKVVSSNPSSNSKPEEIQDADLFRSDGAKNFVASVNTSTKRSHNSWVLGMKSEEIREAQLEDSDLGWILMRLEGAEGKPQRDMVSGRHPKYLDVWDDLVILEGVLYKMSDSDHWNRKPLLVLPEKLRKRALLMLHDARVSGHLGRKKTLRKIRERFYWSGCCRDVIEWVRKCPVCIQKQKPCKSGRAPMMSHNVENRMERISMDVLGPLPTSKKGNRFILCMGDHFTKWITAVPLPNQETKTVANALIEYVISVFGVPREIYTDQGSNFESKLFQELCDLLGIQKSRTCPYCPQSNGYIEAFNKSLAQLLRAYCDENQRDWDVHLPFVMMAYRSSVHESTGYSPNELMLGWNIQLPVDLVFGTSSQNLITDMDEFVERQQEYMAKVHCQARQNAQSAKEKQKHYYDKSSTSHKVKLFRPGNKVWYYRPRKKSGRTPKLQKFWEGPFVVIEQLNPFIYRIGKSFRRDGKEMVVHIDKLRTYYEKEHFDDTYDKRPVTNPASTSPVNTEVVTHSGRKSRRPQWYGISF